jgi:hypothetical protein
MTNGIVNDLKSKIQNFKNKKSLEKENTKTCELDIEVNKELLGKFRKSDSNTNILAQNQTINVNNSTTTPIINMQKTPNFKETENKLDVSTISITKTNGITNSTTANKKINSLLKDINFSDDKTPKSNIVNSILTAKEEKTNPTSEIITASNHTRPVKTFLNFNNDKKNKDDDK